MRNRYYEKVLAKIEGDSIKMKKGWNRCRFLFSNFDMPNSVAKKFQEHKKMTADMSVLNLISTEIFIWKKS